MAGPDRIRFIELLNRLGAEDDDTVLAAARELHRSVKEAGLEWSGLLQADDGSVAAEAETPTSTKTPTDHAGDMKIIDRLLARQDLSDMMRSDLADFKRGIREGAFDRMDADYVRALAKRLGA
jgi:hypothetical protein